jgi:hypothetical protein
MGCIVSGLGIGGGCAGNPLRYPHTGLAESAASAAVQSPILGGWSVYRLNSVDDRASAVAYNSVRDEYLAVWEEHYASEITVYARRVSSDGERLDSAIQVAHYSTYTSCEPAVAYGPVHDKYLVVYSSETKPALPPYTDYNIYGQPINGDGTKAETGFSIGGKTVRQRRPAVAYNSMFDEFLVTWDEEQGIGGWHDIWAQRINANDWTFEPGPACVATGDSKHRYQPDVAYNATRNEYLIAYTRQGDVALAAGPNEYLVVWQDGPSTSYRTIYGRHVSGEGERPSPPFLIAEHANEVCA